jgi:hypothetical protein
VLFRILRAGVALCFVGHGAFGLITKKAWLPYFAVGGIPESAAWPLMPLIGAMDIVIGVLALVWPCRALFVWAAIWAGWTALCRPLASEGWPEFFERAGNYGVPIAILAVVGLRGDWFTRLPLNWPPLTPATRRRLAWALRLTTVTLLAGHGACGVVLLKPSLAHHYALFAADPASLVPMIGWLELALALGVLVRPSPALLAGIAAWKLVSESLFLFSGVTAPIFEVMERGGSYIAPLALAYLLLPSFRPRATFVTTTVAAR